MKIIDNSKKPAPTTFADLPSGMVFAYGSVIVVKMIDGGVVGLRDGGRWGVSPDWIVETVYPDAVLYLHGAPNE